MMMMMKMKKKKNKKNKEKHKKNKKKRKNKKKKRKKGRRRSRRSRRRKGRGLGTAPLAKSPHGGCNLRSFRNVHMSICASFIEPFCHSQTSTEFRRNVSNPHDIHTWHVFVWKFHEHSIPSEPKPCILEVICPNLKSSKVINSAGIGQANMRTVPKSLSVNFFDPSDLKPITSLPSELPRLVELGVGAKVLVGQQAPKKFSSRRLWCFNLHDAIRHWWNSSGSFSNTSAAGFGVEKNIQHTEYLIHDYTFSITHLAGKYIQTHLLSGASIATCNGCDFEK